MKDWAAEEGVADGEIRKRITDAVDRKMAEKVANVGPESMRLVEKNLLLQLLDFHWKEHLLHLDQLRQGINLRAHAQRNPLDEYKREAFDMFESMLSRLRESVTRVMAHVEVRAADPQALVPAPAAPQRMIETREDPAGAPLPLEEGEPLPAGGQGDVGVATRPRPAAAPATSAKVPRNAPCPCGSGKKYKHCHGAAA